MFVNPKHKHASALLCLGSIFLFYFSNFSIATNDGHSDFLKYEIGGMFVGNLKHVIVINNNAVQRVRDGKLFVPLIRNETARHSAFLYNVSSTLRQPTFRSDDSGNLYAYWDNVVIEGKETLIVELDYHVFSLGIRYRVNSSLITDYNESSNLYKQYTQPEELIQSSNPEIVSKAQNLTVNKSSIHEKVSQIYNFVITHVSYASQDEERGALWALENGAGDCSEYSYLFVALCRAIGIPARVQAGYAFATIKTVVEDGHMWAEYYLENYGWMPVDATWRMFDTLDYRHFSSIQSIPEVIPYANYVFNYTSGPANVEEEQKVSLNSQSTIVFGDSFIENAVIAIQKVNQAKTALLLAKLLGATLIFSSEVAMAEQTLLKSQFSLQNAVDFWKTDLQFAQSNIADAIEGAEETAQHAWMLVVYAFILFVGILITVMLTVLVFQRRRLHPR